MLMRDTPWGFTRHRAPPGFSKRQAGTRISDLRNRLVEKNAYPAGNQFKQTLQRCVSALDAEFGHGLRAGGIRLENDGGGLTFGFWNEIQ